MEKIVAYIYGEPHRDSYGERRWNNGVVLTATGDVVPDEMESQGRDLDDWAIDDLTPPGYTGLLVWEGECENLWCRNHGGDWEPSLYGKWRKAFLEDLLDLIHEPQPTFDSAYLGC